MICRQLSRPTTFALVLALGAGGIPSLSLAGSPAPAPLLIERAPDPAPSEPLRAGLRIDTEKLGADGEPIATKIREQAKAVYERESFQDPLDERDPVIVVVVERARNSEDPGYVIGFSIEQGDDIVPGSARQSDCSLCTRTELIERIEGELPKLLELAATVQVQREVPGGDEGGEAGEGGGEGGDEGEPVKAIGPLGFAGIGLGVVGLGGVGAGVALAVKGFEPIDDQPGQRTNYRTPGNVILAVGGVALIAGVVMIALDVSKRKKQRKAGANASRLQWTGTGFAF
jgi:hypothetical protein